MIQASGINLGFTYSLYVFGPYCTDLAKIGFNITSLSEIQRVTFEESYIKSKFEGIIPKLEPHKTDDLWLEIASSLHAFKATYPSKSKKEIIEEVRAKREVFKDKTNEIELVWNEITGWIL